MGIKSNQLLALVSLAFLSRCALNTDASLSDGLVPGGKQIFVILLSKQGNLGGPSGADAVCQSDSYKPSTGTYKALLASSTRRACSTSNCSNSGEGLDWVLAANTKYVQKGSNNEVFTTNANGIFIFGTMTNKFDTNAFSSSEVYTGLTSTWQTSANTCSNWTSSSGAVNGQAGAASSTTSTAISSTTKACSSFAYLVCVEQ